ncbi:MAG: tubulin-like doman-containing protein [Desulfobaccales bacterium]
MPIPSFFIGIGGTGDWVLTFLKAKLQATYGGEIPKTIRFRLLDTVGATLREEAFRAEDQAYNRTTWEGSRREKVAAVETVRIAGSEYVALEQNETKELVNLAKRIRGDEGEGKKIESEYLQWFQADYYLRLLGDTNFTLSLGAGQWRQFGRMALFLNARGTDAPVLTTIQSNLRQLRQAWGGGSEPIPVYIIGSLAGGTGAGIFLDLANLVRHSSHDSTIGEIRLVGVFVLPGAFSRVAGVGELNKSQAYAALRELHRFQSQFGMQEPFFIQYGKNFRTELSSKLFDAVYLLDGDRARHPLDNVLPYEGLFPSIADGLEVFVDAKVGKMLLDTTINQTSEYVKTLTQNPDAAPAHAETVSALFSTFGTWKVILPAWDYSRKFAYQLVRDFIDKLAQPKVQERTITGLLDSIRLGQTDPLVDHKAEATTLLNKAHAIFKDFIDRLPGQPGSADLPKFAEGFQNGQRIVNKYFQVKNAQISPRVIEEGLKLFRDVVERVEDGGEAGETPSYAISRVTRLCTELRTEYFKVNGEFDRSLTFVHDQVMQEVKVGLNDALIKVLQGGASYLERIGTLGYLQRLLSEMTVILDELRLKVMAEIKEVVTQIKGELTAAESKVQTAYADMEPTKTYTKGWLGFGQERIATSIKRQQEYLAAFKGHIQREQLERLINGLEQIFEKTGEHLEQWSDEVNSWARYLCLGVEEEDGRRTNAFQECLTQILMIEDELQRLARSYTSSIGLSVWDPQSSAPPDTTMGGWEEKIFKQMEKTAAGKFLWQEWLESTLWQVSFPPPDQASSKKPVFELTLLEKDAEGREQRVFIGREKVREEFYDRGFALVKGRMQEKSVLEYLQAKHTPEEIAETLHKKTAPMLSTTEQRKTAGFLIYQRKPGFDAFITEIETALQKNDDLKDDKLRKSANLSDNCENPYILTFAILQDIITWDEIRQVESYAQKYWKDMSATDKVEAIPHRHYHSFRCEEEAVKIEKKYYTDRYSFDGAVSLAPLVYRLLEYPDKLKTFMDAQVYGLVGRGWYLDEYEAWCLTHQALADPQASFDVQGVIKGEVEGIVLAWGKGGKSSSLLDALSGFILRGKCLARIEKQLSLNQLTKAITREKERLQQDHQAGYKDIILQKYQSLLQSVNDDKWWETHQKVGGSWEKESLRIIYRYFLKENIARLQGQIDEQR